MSITVEAFQNEYKRYPDYLDELDGKNEREKVFFDGIEEAVDKYDLKIAFDLDNDGYVEVEGKKIEQKIAVWTYYKDQMVRSWDR